MRTPESDRDKKNRMMEELVGRIVTPLLVTRENGTQCTRRLSEDTLALDDDGYYLANMELRIPIGAFIARHYSSNSSKIILTLNESFLEERTLGEIPWQH